MKTVQLKRIVESEILPLLEEYCYEASDVYEELKKHINESLEISPPSQGMAPEQENSNAPPTADDVE